MCTKENIEKAKQYLSNEGYGTGSNFILNIVANLMAEYLEKNSAKTNIRICSRKYCDNIMCDTYIKPIGYICSECKLEFKEYLQKNGLNPKTKDQIKKELVKFINTVYKDKPEITVDDFFSKHTVDNINKN